jgi:class 3 adenylate cyclase/tetratricopeptide (TPR) repeat protein
VSSAVTVTILITDLVGSTGLRTRVGPAAAETLRREHFELLREEIENSDGREVKNLGDGLMVAFSSASGAVACAVAMQQRVERRNRSSDEQLAMRVGISMGDATVEEDDFFGLPVVEAARLCDRAAGGQILASDLIARLAGSAGGHAFAAVGALELKGLPEPVETVETLWEPQDATPLPPRMQEMPPGGFVGRVAERECLAELFHQARKGSRRLALISGEPGIGKTRLSTRTALDSRSEGAVVLYGRCDDELAVPYGLWVEALTHYVEYAPEKTLRAHVERHGGELVRLVASLKDRLPDISAPRETDPDTERYLLWGAVVGLLQEASQEEPLVLVLDDLHWGDKPTLLLLKHVISQGQRIRALVIGTYRESDLTHGHPLAEILAELHREEGVERLSLKGLDQQDVAEIMKRAAGHELDEAGVELSKQLFSETDGNPFYTGELLRHLLESGALRQQDGGRWTVSGTLSELGLPQSVREVLGRRIERLGPEMQKALSVAAVVGREFDTDLLLRVIEYSEDTLLELLEQAVAASVLTESPAVPGRFSFAHALINHTLYEELGTTRRARLHRRVAEALEDLLGADPGERISELAQHWAKATTAVDLSKAVAYARRAGEHALQELAPDEALRWFSQAVELQGQQSRIEPAERCDLLIGLGEAQRQVGEAGFRETLLEACRLASEIGDPDRAARAALANNRGQPSVFGEVDKERMAALERALDLDHSANLAHRAQLISLQAMELEFDSDHQRRRALADGALQFARDADDPRTLAAVLRDHFWTVWAPDTLERRRATVSELLGMLDEVGDPALEFWAVLQEVGVSIESGDLDRAESALLRVVHLADELGQPTLTWFSAYLAGPAFALLRGNLAEAERLAEWALQIGTDAAQADAFMVYGAQFAEICVQQGRGDEIVEVVEENVEANPGIPGWRAGLAHVYCWLGRTEEGGAILQEAAKDRFDHVPWDQFRSSALTLYADAASQAGVRDAAAPLYELLEPWAEQIVWNGGTTYGHVRTYVGLLAATLGWDDLADKHLGLASQILEEKRMLLWASRTRLGWAEALAGQGETERAQAQAARALALAREHGYGAIERRAAAVVETGSAAKR